MSSSNGKSSKGLYEVRQSAIQGRGVFAKRRIRSGQRIIEYTGERISDAEADRRYDDEKMRRHHTFLFTLDKNVCVDGNSGGSDARLINHSCDPNCEAIIEEGEIWIYAKKNIQPGVELGYDYQYERTNDLGDEEFYKCQCGSAKCRGSIMKPDRKKRRRKSTRRN